MRTREGFRVFETEESDCYLAMDGDSFDGSIEVFHIDSFVKNGVLIAEPINITIKDIKEFFTENGYTLEKTNE